LVFVLTFWVVAWPAASIRTGSPYSGWWGTQEAVALRQAARAPTLQGDFAESERIYQHGADLALKRHDPAARAWCLSGVAGSRFAEFNYGGALDAYLQAKSQAERARDRVSLGAIDFDLSELYRQMWDLDSALRSAEQAHKMIQGLTRISYRPQLAFELGSLHADATSIPLYQEGIEAARAASGTDTAQIAVEARGWDLLGEALLGAGDIPRAAQAEQRALALREESAPKDLGFSYWHLGDLRLRERSFAAAESLTRQAMQQPVGPPRYQLEDQLGRILLKQGRVPEALLLMESAIAQAQRWRVEVAPAFTLPDGANIEPTSRIFDGFVEAAADYGIQTHHQRWIGESFQAAELSRAISIQGDTESALQRALPLEYRETLGKLRAEDTKFLQSGARESPASKRLQMKLTEMEARPGFAYLLTNTESFPSNDSLIHVQQRLRSSEILLSFSLGEKESFLWAATRNTLRVYRLPPAGEMRSAIQAFRQAVEGGSIDVEGIGERLYAMLFGQLEPLEASKAAWLLSPEGSLLELPFAALVLSPEQRSGGEQKSHTAQKRDDERKGGRGIFLAERHSLQVIAGTVLPQYAAHSPRTGFLSVGDPIYNFADPRWKSTLPAIGRLRAEFESWFWSSFTHENVVQLNSLPGSRREVEASAAAWGRGTATRVLEGVQASREKFLDSLSPTPEVIHLATHAVTPASGGEAYLVFGLGSNGRLETLSTSEVQTLQVPGSVVVMTGCSTAPSNLRTGLGLAGLVHAWTVAGASAVVATEWAVADNAGASLLSSFYRHLRESPNGVPEALRLAQVEMIRSGEQPAKRESTTQAAPASWAAYQVFGNLQSGMGSRSSAQ
jgi:CHAT domain-containing protein